MDNGNEITPLSKAEQALMAATTPAQSKNVEALAAAARAWAKENDDYESLVEAVRIYILARRKTTELSKPFAPEHGGDRKSIQFFQIQDFHEEILNFNFTPLQWYKRNRELEITQDDIDNYFDNCIEKSTEPTLYGLLRYSFPSSLHISDDSHEWYTPAEYIEAARGVMGSIDLDPASHPDANEIIQATTYYTALDDGLAQPWFGNVWMNPPYNMPLIEQFVARAIDEYEGGNIDRAIILTNNSTDTEWMQSLLSYPVCFTNGRVKFYNGDEKLATRQGQAIAYLGENPDLFAKVFGVFGRVMKPYDSKQS